MADDITPPTAILPTRPGGLRRRYDDLSERTGLDPLRKLFELAATAEKEEVQLGAAKELVSYRYAKPAKPAPQLQVNTGGGGVNIIWSKAPPAAERTIDVTPSPSPSLEEMLG